jgi:hypothetical protein
MGETKTKYVCRMLGDGVLPRKHVRLGEVVKVPKRAVRIETPDHEREIPRQDKTQEESTLPQGRGDSLVAQLDSAVNQAEQLRDQQIQQQYTDQLGIYVQEKAQQIDRLQSSLAASLTSEQAQLQATQQGVPLHLQRVALLDVPSQKLLGRRILQVFLHSMAHRSSAVGWIVSLIDQKLDCGPIQVNLRRCA